MLMEPLTLPLWPAGILPSAHLPRETVLCFQLLVRRPTAAVTSHVSE